MTGAAVAVGAGGSAAARASSSAISASASASNGAGASKIDRSKSAGRSTWIGGATRRSRTGAVATAVASWRAGVWSAGAAGHVAPGWAPRRRRFSVRTWERLRIMLR